MYQLTTNASLVHSFLKIITATLPPEPANATQSTWEAHWAAGGFNAAGEAFDDYFYMYRGSLTTPPCTPVTFVFHPYWSYTSQVCLVLFAFSMPIISYNALIGMQILSVGIG
jgi:hypothetical protein